MKLGVVVGLALLGLFSMLLLLWQPGGASSPAMPHAGRAGSAAPEGASPPMPAGRGEARRHPTPMVREEPARQEPSPPRAPEPAPLEPPAPQSAPNESSTPYMPKPTEPTGPVDALERAYETDDVDVKAGEVAAEIRAMSGTEHVPPGAIRGVRCTERVCRLVMHWSPKASRAHITVGMRLHARMGGPVALEPLGDPDDEEMEVRIYVTRPGHADDFAKNKGKNAPPD